MATKERPPELLLKQWHEDPKYWKLGVLYYNKENKRLFPPKRFKYTGWTINFANAYSILALVALTAILVIVGVMFS